ncbi:hypothetical protein QGM71_05865 [Virgibacillus sp. C22-A2]|uniref:Uncharacterized protein n=1 Tax=Virgibacillus tibetensis TaxID=3042313 RepID=A0ABU6KCZ5_9BACI|nr:hypothetical protein [Virgibacillus sp. C22-A2]
MIRTYQLNTRDIEPAMDLHQKLLGVSSKFKKLSSKKDEDVDEKVS